MIDELALLVGAGVFFYLYINEKEEHLKYLWIVMGMAFTAFSFVTNTGILTTSSNTLNGNVVTTFNYGQVLQQTNWLSLANVFTAVILALLCFFVIAFFLAIYKLVTGTGTGLGKK